jgi:hypothetical protein
MSIRLHLILRIVCSCAGALGGAMLGAFAGMFALSALDARGVREPIAYFLAGAPLFFGGAALGLILGRTFAIYCLSACCPKCQGRSYYQAGQPITYHCRACGHVHETGSAGVGLVGRCARGGSETPMAGPPVIPFRPRALKGQFP